MNRSYYVYILTNQQYTVLYTGVTNDLERRLIEHAQGAVPGFTHRYNLNKLVYFEETDQIAAAIAREREIKGWIRAKKVTLIESLNPDWHDLAADWPAAQPNPSLRSG